MTTISRLLPTGWLPIRQYREFWDVPRMFLVESEEKQYLFDCAFDEELEDYSGVYQVFLMPQIVDAELEGSWVQLPSRALRGLGTIPVTSVAFDTTRRAAIDGRILPSLRPILRTTIGTLVESEVRA